MTDPITRTQLENANLDAVALSHFTNDGASPGTYTTRTGRVGQTLAKIEQTADAAAAIAAASASSVGSNLFTQPVEKIADDPDGTPTIGMRRLVGTGTGDWEGYDNQVSEYFADGWHFSGAPSNGQQVFIQDAGQHVYIGAWRPTEIISAIWFLTGADIGQAIGDAVTYALANTGGRIVVPPGSYNWDTAVSFTVPGSFAYQIVFDFTGAVFNHTASGYALEITKTGPDPHYGEMNVSGYGGFWNGPASSSASSGALHFIDCTNMLWLNPEGAGYDYISDDGPDETMGCIVRVTTDAIQTEIASIWRPRGVNSAALMVFDLTAYAVTNDKDSFLRTSVIEPFFATGSGPGEGTWFFVGDGVDLGDSAFRDIKGNWTCNSLFFIGSGVNMGGTVIDGVSIEVNDTDVAKGLVVLSDHPSSSSTSRRPTILNVSHRAVAAGSGVTLPVWVNASFTEVRPEWKLEQPLNMQGVQLCGPIARSPRLTNPNGVGDSSGLCLGRSGAAILSLTPGASATVIPIPGLEGDGSNLGIFAGAVQVRVWGKNGQAALVSNACRASASSAATVTNAVSVADTSGRSLSLDWTGSYLSIALSGTGAAVSYMIDVSGVFQ